MGLEVVERVTLVTVATDDARSYLRTKKEKLGHLLEIV
jgi:GTP cyclohydrolase II